MKLIAKLINVFSNKTLRVKTEAELMHEKAAARIEEERQKLPVFLKNCMEYIDDHAKSGSMYCLLSDGIDLFGPHPPKIPTFRKNRNELAAMLKAKNFRVQESTYGLRVSWNKK